MATRILVAGGDAVARGGAAGMLRASDLGLVTEVADLTARAVREGPYDLVLVLGDDVVRACATARQLSSLAGVPLLALVPREPAGVAEAAVAAGADDVVHEPPAVGGLAVRARFHLRAAEDRRQVLASRLCERALLDVLRLATADGDVVDGLREALARAVPVLGFDAAALVLIGDMSDQAVVVCASDEPDVVKLTVDVEAFPEVRAVQAGREAVIAPEVAAHPLLGGLSDHLGEAQVRALAAFPIEWKGRAQGAVTFRAARPLARPLDEARVAFGRTLGAVIASRLGGGQVLEQVREQTHRITLARYESERRLRAIEQVKDYFQASSDGIFVLDGDGVILFANRAAEAITGFAREGLVGTPLARLLGAGGASSSGGGWTDDGGGWTDGGGAAARAAGDWPDGGAAGRGPGPLAFDDEAATLEEVTGQVLGGTNLEAFDLHLVTSSGDPLCVSVSTSTVLAEHGAAILSFRDVTAERALETELRKTKDFLEKLIDSAVDAIIAADIRGHIILFNRGAERLYGYVSEEVLDQVHVTELYPEGVARQIMRGLRSASSGGVGRLEPTRREIVTKAGEVVPVSMTAAIVYENGQEVATVGILTDLRDRIRIEQRLLQAQEKLQVTEKQALVAELAGAAAHELNQPLTSVMGYAELLRKRMSPDDPHFRGVDTILREAERMAEIVKKIGRITRYETKAYVGTAQILDLEASAAHAGDPGPDKEPSGGGGREAGRGGIRQD